MVDKKKRTLMEILSYKKRVAIRKFKQNQLRKAGEKVLLTGGLIGVMSLSPKSAEAQNSSRDKTIHHSELVADAGKIDMSKIMEYMMYEEVDIESALEDVIENDILSFQEALENKYRVVNRYKRAARKRVFGNGLNYCAIQPALVFKTVAARDSIDYIKDLYVNLVNPNSCGVMLEQARELFPDRVSKKIKLDKHKKYKNGDFIIVDLRKTKSRRNANTTSGLHLITYFEGRFYEMVGDETKREKKGKGSFLSFNNESYEEVDSSYWGGQSGWVLSTAEMAKDVIKDKIYHLSIIEQKKYLYKQMQRVDEDRLLKFRAFRDFKEVPEKTLVLDRIQPIEKVRLESPHLEVKHKVASFGNKIKPIAVNPVASQKKQKMR
ncbi:MAG: hypothetical protein PHE89_06885 [Alphaproteobacteria bacterium]|nr:hypothetical protein [Alphaproteobacteria bacterium]